MSNNQPSLLSIVDIIHSTELTEEQKLLAVEKAVKNLKSFKAFEFRQSVSKILTHYGFPAIP